MDLKYLKYFVDDFEIIDRDDYIEIRVWLKNGSIKRLALDLLEKYKKEIFGD